MKALIGALTALNTSVQYLTESTAKLAVAQNDIAREQRVTNLIVRSQVTKDPGEKQRLLDEARERMDRPRRRSPHDPL